MAPPVSPWWKYFVKDKDKGRCKVCKKDVKRPGCTTNLRMHMERHHADVLSADTAVKNPSATIEQEPQVT